MFSSKETKRRMKKDPKQSLNTDDAFQETASIHKGLYKGLKSEEELLTLMF